MQDKLKVLKSELNQQRGMFTNIVQETDTEVPAIYALSEPNTQHHLGKVIL